MEPQTDLTKVSEQVRVRATINLPFYFTWCLSQTMYGSSASGQWLGPSTCPYFRYIFLYSFYFFSHFFTLLFHPFLPFFPSICEVGQRSLPKMFILAVGTEYWIDYRLVCWKKEAFGVKLENIGVRVERFSDCFLYKKAWWWGSLNNTNWSFPWLGLDHAVFLKFSIREQMSSNDFPTNVCSLRSELCLFLQLQKCVVYNL